MKQTFARPLLLFFLLFPFTRLPLSAQDITGIWRGYFITESFDQYKFELQLKQSGNSVSGVSYSYLSTVFYGKATLTGNFNKDGQSALIKEIKTIELRMSGGSQACIMKCIFSYARSGKEEFLEGTFTSKFEKSSFMNKIGDNCGGGKVYLRKVTTSDFYIEPFLRDKINSTPIILNKPPIKKDIGKTKSPTPDKKPVVVKIPATKPVTKPILQPIISPVTKTNSDSIKITTPVTITKPPVIVAKPAVLQNRTNELMKVLTVNNQEVTVKLYDNGEIDGDSISVYYDNKLVLSNKGLSASPLVIKLKMDDDNTEHELVMVALNLGRIPPNTALMVVESGDQRFNVQITSTEQKNAVVRFKYQKPN